MRLWSAVRCSLDLDLLLKRVDRHRNARVDTRLRNAPNDLGVLEVLPRGDDAVADQEQLEERRCRNAQRVHRDVRRLRDLRIVVGEIASIRRGLRQNSAVDERGLELRRAALVTARNRGAIDARAAVRGGIGERELRLGPACEPRLAQRDLRGLEVALVDREIEVVELDLFDERGELRIVEVVPPVGVRPNARFVEYGPDEALRHVALGQRRRLHRGAGAQSQQSRNAGNVRLAIHSTAPPPDRDARPCARERNRTPSPSRPRS